MEDALRLLDETRARVEAGEIKGFAITMLLADGRIPTAWSSGCGREKFMTLGAVSCLTARLHKSIEHPEW